MEADRFDLRMNDLMGTLTNHRMYQSLNTLDDLKVFTELHVFAVWDFMSLLKSLQSSLASSKTPWTPNTNSNAARFINEIVMCEETDSDLNGTFKSHFEMYLDSMEEIGSDTKKIRTFVNFIKQGETVKDSLVKAEVNESVAAFVNFTFEVIDTRKDHFIASAFTHGREGLIPDVFIEILNKSEFLSNSSYESFKYYLQRHIELDGDEHGPLSLKMVAELCDDSQKVLESNEIAIASIKHRIKLWDAIADAIEEK